MSSRMGLRGAFLGSGQQQYTPAPNAALLIDFDNVTMAIRSDLGKELKTLLKSDVIRGKVAVQRAYADWRRYPQYIVPLTESSVDLIFAPAYGSSKKNATDLRMAIDAIELVFTRPEIGTFILMTGDSDFSSCVLKLKEYGKYVIGVGMRESSSDLLIQNCDEYYSYHSISGLTRAGEVEESTEDPWVLVKRAVQQMVKNGDVMRTDRLKQVMLELDPGFDEKKVGYSKFSRFVSEAASKGVLHLRKTENGQHEILPTEQKEAPREPVRETKPDSREKVVERIVAEAEAGGNGRRRRGRGREERFRERREEQPDRSPDLASEPEEIQPPVLEAVPRAEPAAPRPPQVEPEHAVAAAPKPDGAERNALAAPSDLNGAYALLQEAVRRLTGRGAKTVRDGDVKRKMLELSKEFDETQLGFSKFTRFLRQAHDVEVIDLNRVGAGNYEVGLPAGGKKLPSPPLAAPADTGAGAVQTRQAAPASERPDRGEVGREERKPAAAPEARVQPALETAAPAAPSAPATTPAATAPPSAPQVPSTPGVGALRGRRGGRAPLAGPPPILPGQAITAPRKPELPAQTAAAGAPADAGKAPIAEPEIVATGAGAQEEAGAEEARGKGRSRRGRRGRGREKATAPEAAGTPAVSGETGEPTPPRTEPSAATTSAAPRAEETPSTAEKTAVGEPEKAARKQTRRGRRGAGKVAATESSEPAAPAAAAEPAPAAAQESGKRAGGTRGRGRGRAAAPAAEQGPAAPERSTSFSAEELGLPRDASAISSYLMTSYKGIGKKTADALLERFGTAVFQALHERPEEVKAVLDERRATALLDQWKGDFARRTKTTASPPQTEAAASPAGEAKDQSVTPKSGGRGRRGGRGRSGTRKEPASIK